MSSDLDALDALLRQVLEEGLADGEALPALLAAFRERAELLLAERVRSLEREVRALHEEVAWRKGMMQARGTELELLAAMVPWRPLRVRQRLKELAEAFRKGQA